jgi:hypothetical protein
MCNHAAHRMFHIRGSARFSISHPEELAHVRVSEGDWTRGDKPRSAAFHIHHLGAIR